MGTGWGQNSKGYRYFFKGTGIMATGLVTNSKGQHRFFNKSTGYMFQGLQKYGGYYYYFDENNGFRYEKGFKTIGKNTYYFNKNGRAQTGWLTLNGVKYYFNSKGVMYKGTTANIGGQEYNFGSNGAVISKLTASQKDVMKKILYAVETGGQVYGNADYADFTQAYTNSSAEHAITIGAGQWYATEAQRLLKLIRSTDPTTFNKYDKQYAKGALSKDLDSANWSTYNIKKTDVRAKAIVAIISSKSGIKCQDQLVYEQIEEYEDIITARYGAMSADAMMECINIIHQGGMGSLSRILNKTSKPYSAEKIYDTLCLDPYDTSSNNQVGDYTSRQKCVITWIRLYCK